LADAIEQSRKELEYFLWAYVFMPEHVHLVICPRKPQYSVSDILRCIKQPVIRKAVSFLRQNRPEWLEHISKPRRRRTEYHFWLSGGGYDRNIVEPGTLMTMIEYIHLNPVRRGLVERAVDWKWSSAGWFAELQPNRLQPDPIPYEWVND
jgi:putative transposase